MKRIEKVQVDPIYLELSGAKKNPRGNPNLGGDYIGCSAVVSEKAPGICGFAYKIIQHMT